MDHFAQIVRQSPVTFIMSRIAAQVIMPIKEMSDVVAQSSTWKDNVMSQASEIVFDRYCIRRKTNCSHQIIKVQLVMAIFQTTRNSSVVSAYGSMRQRSGPRILTTICSVSLSPLKHALVHDRARHL